MADRMFATVVRRSVAGIAALATFAAPAASHAAPSSLTPGDLVGTDYGTESFNEGQIPGTLFGVATATGARALLSANDAPSDGPPFTKARGVAFEDDGHLLVVGTDGPEGPGSLLRVSPLTGERTLVSGRGRGTGVDMSDPTGVAVAPDGTIYVTDPQAADGTPGTTVIRVDPATGDRTVVTSQARGAGPTLDAIGGILVEPSGSLVLTDRNDGVLVRVDPATGDRTMLSDGSNGGRGTGPAFSGPSDLARRADGTLIVSDRFFLKAGAVFAVDPVTGDRTILSSPVLGAGVAFNGPWSLALGDDGSIYTGGTDPGAPGILRVDPSTGARSTLSGNATPGATPTLRQTFGLEVVPPAPVVGGPDIVTAKEGEPLDVRLPGERGATGQRPTAMAADGTLPAGVTAGQASPRRGRALSDPTPAVVLAGTPAAGTTGTYDLQVTATNAAFRVTRAIHVVVGRTPVVDVPAAVGTPTPVTGGSATPPTRSCGSRRRVTIHLMVPRRYRVQRTTVRVQGVRVATLDGRTSSLTLNFKGRPPSRVRVDLRAVTADGKVLTGRRSYRLCLFVGSGRIPLVPLRERKG